MMVRRMAARHATFVCAVLVATLFFAAEACGGSDARRTPSPSPSPSPTPSGPWQLVWSDEFDGSGAPDPGKWVHDLGGNGWGNDELETYTDRVENAARRGGVLVVTARKETATGNDGIERPYTSARLKTLGTYAFTYGKVEARMRLPRGQGVWPAFWMLGEDIAAAGWPACGELDIMENIGKEPTTVHGTLHGPGYSGAQAVGAPFGGPVFADDFHVFGVEWEPDVIRWYVDGTLYQTRTPDDLPAGSRWVFDHPFFVILNLAIGGNWPGPPDQSTVLPQELLVDWVRVSQRRN